MWYPEITNRLSGNDPQGRVCDIFSGSANNESQSEVIWDDCTVDIQDKMYIDNAILGVGYLVAVTTFYYCNSKIRILYLVMSSMTISSVCAFLLPSLSNPVLILICFTLFLVGSGTGITIVNILLVQIFPTYVCAMALSLTLLVGRFGAIVGSNGLGVLLETNCELTVYGVASLIGCGVICAYLLPKHIEI